jgi:hypothetical protein
VKTFIDSRGAVSLSGLQKNMPPDNDKTDNIEITVLKPRPSLMRLLLGFGIYFHTPAQITLNSFLREFLALDQDYIDNRIQTMFMDGKPVDDPEKTLIKKDCEIGLSAAMPGVFGAAFRKQGIYSGLRRQTGDDEKKPEYAIMAQSISHGPIPRPQAETGRRDHSGQAGYQDLF